MKFKNPIAIIVLVFFLVTNLLDSIFTFFVLPGEANPIYLLTGSVWYLIIFKIILIGGLWWIYLKHQFATEFQYYNFLLVLVMANTFLMIAIITNLYHLFTVAPEVIAAQANVPAATKMKGYFLVSSAMYLLPYAMSLFTFFLFDKSKKYVEFKK